MATTQVTTELAIKTANAIRRGFVEYHAEFKEITRRAKQRFEFCDWHGMHSDAETRLELHKDYVLQCVGDLKEELAEQSGDAAFWREVKAQFTECISDREDFDLAESFYNSVAMRVAETVGMHPDLHYVGSEFKAAPRPAEGPEYLVYHNNDSVQALLCDILNGCRFDVGFRDLDEDTALAAQQVETYMRDCGHKGDVESIEITNPVFYRGKTAYLVGRIRTTEGTFLPLVLSLMNDSDGIYIDAVLLTEDEVSIVFSFARSYFHIDVQRPYSLVRFLKSIMPLKPVAELYISLGYNKHGKTELYRDLVRFLESSTDRFEIARGARGMVMIVFTLPSYDVVFKIIKDSFDYPKTTTRQDVRNRYHLVFKHDRGGRLVDAQEFEHLRFEKDRFTPELLDELLDLASQTVSVEGDAVNIKHLYTERRLDPLNLYLKEVEESEAEDSVIDYGQTIKDLAATNIFPGDILLKNFGVTRHGRVVFYDYDELCLLTDCRFREMPQTTDSDEEMSAEPWFSVDEQDVFPEELKSFLGLPPQLTRVFKEHHGELFDVQFWANMQARITAGEVIEITPYKDGRRLHHNDS